MTKSAQIEKTVSYIMAIPRESADIDDPDKVRQRLLAAEEFEALTLGFDEEADTPFVEVRYKEQDYRIDFYPEDFDLPELFAVNHAFSEEDYAIMENATWGLTMAMTFGDNAQESYHVQIKVLAAMVPNLAGIVDFGSERIYSGVWADMAAISQVPPSPDYLYSIQAIGGQGDDVWLHTHGLNRLGLVELEVIGSDTANYGNHGIVLRIMAQDAVVSGYLEDAGEPIFVAALAAGGALVCTWQHWQDKLNDYDPYLVGGMGDRHDSHCGESGLVFYYPSQETYEQGEAHRLNELDDAVFDNMLHMISDGETQRMSALAQERVAFLADGLTIEGAEAIVKMRLPVDKEQQDAAGCPYEHIWFAVERMDEESIWGELTQEPYYIADLHTGDSKQMPLSDLTDWILYIGEQQITPDSAYILVQR